MDIIKNQIINIIFIFACFLFSAKDIHISDYDINSLIEHEVKAGDNLWDIAKQYNSSIYHIKKINNIKSNIIHVGWNIRIPDQIYIEKMDLDIKWNNALQFRKDSKLMESITLFKEIIDIGSNNFLSSKAQFQIADIYLNDINNYIFAVREFKKIVDNYPDSEDTKKSIFMLGYINSNYIEAYSDALFYYNMFLEQYPSDELSHSVNYELELLDSLNIPENLENLRKDK